MVANGPNELEAANAVQIQGKVKSIDKQNRSVVIVGPQSNEVTQAIGPQVRNFDQIKVGDLATLTYVQAVALELRLLSREIAKLAIPLPIHPEININ